MAQVTGHDVMSNGDHVLTMDTGKKITVAGSKVAKDASWGEVLKTAGGDEGDGVKNETLGS